MPVSHHWLASSSLIRPAGSIKASLSKVESWNVCWKAEKFGARSKVVWEEKLSRWNASDLDAVEGGSGRVLSNKLHLFAQPSLCCKVAKQKYWEVKVATTFVTRTCGYIESMYDTTFIHWLLRDVAANIHVLNCCLFDAVIDAKMQHPLLTQLMQCCNPLSLCDRRNTYRTHRAVPVPSPRCWLNCEKLKTNRSEGRKMCWFVLAGRPLGN